MKAYMYILLCGNGKYYTGSTNDLEKRMEQHQNGEGANFTKKHLPVELIYFEEFQKIDEAFYREKQVQGWSRIKKEILIRGEHNQLHELSACKNNTHFKPHDEYSQGNSRPSAQVENPALRLGFIGIGKIASAVIEGIATSNLSDAVLRLSPRNEGNSRQLAAKFPNVFRMKSNQEVLDQSDIIFLALRTGHAREIISELNFSKNHTVISFIPLLKYSDLQQLVEPAVNISRAIPLPPVVNHDCPIPVFNFNKTVVDILSNIGQTFMVSDENQLHTIWTLTCLITPYYELLHELSSWSVRHGVDRENANLYIANLFQALAHTAQIADPIEFDALARHAATPNGMNEQTGREIREAGAHELYCLAAEKILGRFPRG